METRFEKKKDLQGIKRLVPHRRLSLTLNAFSLFRLLCLLFRRLMSYSDKELPLHTKEGLDMGNVECSED
jgi:hypothetical protein